MDDFYLKPHASLQLLRLLRMISIPRVFFLVMGDITTVEALFVEKSLADWTAVAGPEIFATLHGRQDEALGRARELRARYLRKLLPPRQRAVIEAMDWFEALDFKPERLNGKETDIDMPKEDVGTLRKLLETRKFDSTLEKRDIDSATDNNSLVKFLISPPLGNETWQQIKGEGDQKYKNIRKAREAYTALQILDATSREIMDLWFALNDLQDLKDAPPLLSCVLDFVELVIEEQNFLNETQHGILFGILPTRHYTAQEIYLDMNRLRLQPEQNTWDSLIGKDQEQTEPNQTIHELWVRKHRSWKLGVNTDEGESNEDEGLFAKLPPRQTAWIVLMHDLAWKWNPERVTGNLVQKLCSDLDNWLRVPSPLSSPPTVSPNGLQMKREYKTEVKHFRFQHIVSLIKLWNRDERLEGNQELVRPKDLRGWAVWQNGSTYEHFPMPSFKTFRDLDRFLFIWSSGLEGLKNKQEVEKIFDLWELAGRTIVLDECKDFIEGGDDWYRKFAERKDDWYEDLAKRLEEINQKQLEYLSSPPNGNENTEKLQRKLDEMNEWVVKVETLEKKVSDSMNSSPPQV